MNGVVKVDPVFVSGEPRVSNRAVLALEDGSLFFGQSIGCSGLTVGEVVFNTSMSGYQEILTDPSYAQQIITLTCPHIGNVGTNQADCESAHVRAKGLVIRDLSMVTSNWRSELSLSDFLQQHNVIGIGDIDTRRLTRILREKGAQNGCIMAGDIDQDKALAAAKQFLGLNNLDLAKEVTTDKTYEWTHPSVDWRGVGLAVKPTGYHLVVYDFGVKQNILRMFVDRGCRLTVVPATTAAEDVLALAPDGVFLSNGPGDPAPCGYAIKAIQQLLEKSVPLFGICLGHQLLALALGAKTMKMKFGHHGANHPIKDLRSGGVFITSQNHGFAVDENNLPDNLTVTHRSLFDQTIQGIRHRTKPAMGFQGHPEASPGPTEMAQVFDEFIEMLKVNQSIKKKRQHEVNETEVG